MGADGDGDGDVIGCTGAAGACGPSLDRTGSYKNY
jgi:hypothetical protein